MRHWLSIANRIERITQSFAFFGRWAVLLMLGLGLWNVVGRYLGVAIGHKLSSNGLIEGQWYLFDLVFLLGLSWTLQQNGHVRVDVLQSRWSVTRQIRMEIWGTLALLLPFAFGVMAISIEPALHSWSIHELSPDPNGLPRYWIKSLIPIGFLLLTLQGLAEAIKNWSLLRKSSTIHQSQLQQSEEKSLD